MSVEELLRSLLCWICADPLGDEPTQEVPGQPGWSAHTECVHEHEGDDT